MAFQLGKFIRQEYNGILPQTYDDVHIVSRSTSFERTVRTGVGVLRGMFETEESRKLNGSDRFVIPYLTRQMRDVDELLGYYYSWPSTVIRGHWIDTYNARSIPNTLHILNQTTLDKIGAALGSRKVCTENPTTCALLAEDISMCRLTNGGLSEFLRSLLPELYQAQVESNAFLYLYDHTNRYWQNTGPYGLELVQLMGKYFEARLNQSREGTNTDSAPRLYHFSAHDVTIYGFFVALGAINATTTDLRRLVPSFAAATFVELYDDGTVRFSIRDLEPRVPQRV